MQYIFTFTYTTKPKNISLIYDLKQKKFKVIPPFLKALRLTTNILFNFKSSVNGSSIIIVILL